MPSNKDNARNQHLASSQPQMTRQQNNNTVIDTQDNMTPTELSNPTIVGPERFSTTEAQVNKLSIAIMTFQGP